MLIQVAVLGVALATTPLCIAALTQEPVAPEPAAPAPAFDEARLREALAAARQRATRAERRVAALEQQLEAALDLLDESQNERRSNCTPSRRRLAQFQFLRRHGHDERAARTLDQIVKRHGRDAGHLNSLAWRLMTDDETTGKFDDVALALAQRMQQHENRLSHEMLDTVALAWFLNGDAAQAVRLQRAALDKDDDNRDYRRRLRTYEAALRRSGVAAPAPLAAGGGD